MNLENLTPDPYSITTSHLNALEHRNEAFIGFPLPRKKQRQTPPRVRSPRSIVRLLACSLSLDIVADDAVRVRRSEQFVEVVLDVVVHADRQVPLCGEREDESFFRLSKFVCGRGKEARKRR
jgi:hypothetical protein